MGYGFTGPGGTHGEQLADALHALRRHLEKGKPVEQFYLNAALLLETAVDYITQAEENR